MIEVTLVLILALILMAFVMEIVDSKNHINLSRFIQAKIEKERRRKKYGI